MEQEQMHKQFYCKVCQGKRMFVEHAEKKGTWICCQCRYTTSNPKQDPKMPDRKTNTMNAFYNSIVEKSQAFQRLNQEKSC